MSAPIRLRVASYNIHRCVGTDGRRDVARVAEVLRQIGADVVGLQEVDSWLLRAERSPVDELARSLGMSPIVGPTIRHAHWHYGNAVLVRAPALEVRHLDLTMYRREPRAAIDLDIAAGGTRIRLISTHLGLLPGERRSQVRRLLGTLHPDEPVVLMGDINEWFAVGRPLRWMHARLGRTPALRTYPAALPMFALDRIWVRITGASVNRHVHDNALARMASDHLPMVAVIELPEGSPHR